MDNDLEANRALFRQLHDKLHTKESDQKEEKSSRNQGNSSSSGQKKEQHKKQRQDNKTRSKPSPQKILEMHAAVLGIAPDADKSTIVKAFRNRAQMSHPDKVDGLAPAIQAAAKEEMIKVSQAYEYFKANGRA